MLWLIDSRKIVEPTQDCSPVRALTNQRKNRIMVSVNITASHLSLKTCSCCREEKDRSSFYRDKKTKDGLYSRCKPCHLAATSQWSKENKGSIAASARARRKKDPEKYRAYQREFKTDQYAKNPEKFRALSKANRAKDPAKTNAVSAASRAKKPEHTAQYQADYYERHKARIKLNVKQRAELLREELKPANCERVMRRNARKILASPAWANVSAMKAVYVRAAELTKETGIKHHVDHVVPLQSRKVCGLHVENNLQILTAKQNQEKSNKWWPDSP